MRILSTAVFGLAASILFVPLIANGQMEKRSHKLYLLDEFVCSNPAPGTLAPELMLKTLKGKTCYLSDYYGKTLVVIKGSYT